MFQILMILGEIPQRLKLCDNEPANRFSFDKGEISWFWLWSGVFSKFKIHDQIAGIIWQQPPSEKLDGSEMTMRKKGTGNTEYFDFKQRMFS